MTLKEIDLHIDSMLGQLEQEGPCGTFGTMKINPASSVGMHWQREPDNAFVLANVLLPIVQMKNGQAERIVRSAQGQIARYCDPSGMWRYFDDPVSPFFIPYETDTNALLSHIGQLTGGYRVKDDLFLHQLGADGHFNLWFLPSCKLALKESRHVISLLRNRAKAKAYLAYRNGVIEDADREFCVTANVLTYLGERPETLRAIHRLMDEMTANSPIGLLYYPFETIACYLFARCRFYGGIASFDKAHDVLVERLQQSRDAGPAIPGSRWLTVPAASAMLFMNASGHATDMAVAAAIATIETCPFAPYPFYCSNSVTDRDPVSGLHNAYFGSTALTIAHAMEFLNLLRMRRHAGHFGKA
ncbi:MAG: hypothetical protein K9J06_12400 [Flavobacteriales bacterium]|nr:hypothetical protein [Flavobacteriales bacterium]